LSSITINLFSLTNIIMPSSKHVTQQKIQCHMPYSHQVLCLACQESCLAPQLLWQHLSKNDSCSTSWLNFSNSGTLLAVLCSPNPTNKNARAQWSEFSAIESDDDDNDFLYHQLPVYHHNPADDQANLVKLELVNLVLEIGAPLQSFHKIAQWAARANSCGHIFKPDDCPHYKTYPKDLTKRLELDSKP
jgi:hypothetical protein